MWKEIKAPVKRHAEKFVIIKKILKRNKKFFGLCVKKLIFLFPKFSFL
jgi:hypothetical protein